MSVCVCVLKWDFTRSYCHSLLYGISDYNGNRFCKIVKMVKEIVKNVIYLLGDIFFSVTDDCLS